MSSTPLQLSEYGYDAIDTQDSLLANLDTPPKADSIQIMPSSEPNFTYKYPQPPRNASSDRQFGENDRSNLHFGNVGSRGKLLIRKQSKKARIQRLSGNLDPNDPRDVLPVLRVLRAMFFGQPISVLLVFIPFAWASHAYGWEPTFVFWLNFLAMIPLASILGDFTEEVAAHTNQVIGGLVNATFGNAVEVVVGVQALLANEIRVVQASMLGSIFSNLLLVLGCCCFFGGLKFKEQSFNTTSSSSNMSLLALSSLALVLPTPFAHYYDIEDEHVLFISRIVACFLIFMYAQLLLFQLKTHSYLFQDDSEDKPHMALWIAISGLLFLTLLITKLSDYLVQSIDGFCDSSGVSRTFVGLIILPIVGNAVEHITAVTVARKNKMDLSMGGEFYLDIMSPFLRRSYFFLLST